MKVLRVVYEKPIAYVLLDNHDELHINHPTDLPRIDDVVTNWLDKEIFLTRMTGSLTSYSIIQRGTVDHNRIIYICDEIAHYP